MAEGGTVTYSSKEKLNSGGDQKRIAGDGGISSNTVEVQGLSADISQEVVEMYFENSRRSGGGDIEEVQFNDGIAYITFVEAETAQRVVSHSSHQVVGKTLTVTLYHPPPTKPCYDNRVLVQELNSAVTEELLTNFLVTETGARVTEILYGEEVGRVVVTFSSCIDFDALRKACRETRIKSTFLHVARVAISNCILVWNLQLSAIHEVILLYFENKRRSGGGEVERVEMVPEERYCLVYFEDNTVIDRVLSQTHKIDGADVKVHLHHECLGRRSSTNRSQLCFTISNIGNKDTATLDDTPNENSIQVSSDSISSDYDKASDFVEVPEWQINDDTATLDDTSTKNSMKENFSSTDISIDYDKASDFVEVAEWQLNDAKAEEPGLEQRVWSYPNGKKIMLVKATSYDADVIIIPGNSDKDSQSHSGDKNVIIFKVPDGTEMKAMTVLQQEIKEVLDRILEKTVGICIKTMEGWNFLRYLKCFLYEIYKCFIRNEGMSCPIECVILLVDDASDYNNARKIIQKSFKLEQDKSEVFASQRLLLQEQGSVFKRIRVQVQKGQLHEAKVEVLVNTVDRSLDLTKGVISSSLLDKAGNGIQRELQQYQRNFVFGEVLKTGVGTLPKPCKAIFHGVLYVYEEHSDCLKVFQDFILGCLEDANKKYKSIAFPPIGIGKLRYPKYLVALIMFQSVAKFEQAHPKCQLEEVILVIHEKDEETLKVFEELYRTYVVNTVADHPKAMPAVSGVSKMLKYGQVQVQAKLGDFENESQNCLLVLWEKQCLYNITGKNLILRSAGSKVAQKWREHRNARLFHQDVVLVTPGGNLRYTEIVHVASDINNIKKAAKAGLKKADIEKMKTVVVPITHDDSFQRDAQIFCTEILKAVKELGKKLKFVQSVTLVIQGEHNFPLFNEVFEQQSRMYGSEKKTDAAFEKVKEMHVTEPQEASPSSSEKVVPIATTEKIKDPSTAVGVSASSSQEKTVVKEPVSPDITEANRSGGKDTGPLKTILPGQEKHKSTVLQYSIEEQCSFLVCDIKQEDVRRLEEQIKSFDSTAKLVYPYEKGEALVICKNSEDQNTLLNKLEQYKVHSVGPQEKIKDPSTAVGVSASSSQEKTVVKEPVSPDITEANRSGGKDTGPLKTILPGQEKHKSTVLQYSIEEQCSFLVCDIKQEDVRRLEEQIKSFDSTAKLVYPYEKGEALVICKNSEDKNTLLNKLEQYKVHSVGPQKSQGLTAVGPQTWKKVRKVKKKQDPDKVEQQSEVAISHTESSVQFKAVPSQQKETSEIKKQKRAHENSLSGDIENTEKIMNVSQSDFLALQSLKIYFEWTHKFNIKFTHEKETMYVQGALSDLSEEMKKEIEKEIAALRERQKTELPYDPQEIMQFRSAVEEAKSDQLLLVWDDDNKQVLVYSDGFEDIQKFRHKVEFKMGKMKPTSRSGRRFANQEYTMPLLSDEETPVEKKITLPKSNHL